MMQTLIEISDAVVLFASIACLVFIVFIHHSIRSMNENAMYSIVKKDVDELMDEKRRRYMLDDKYWRMKKYLNECALKFRHSSACLRDMKNEHDMREDLRDQIDGLIRDLDGFASDVNSFIEKQ